MITRENAEFEGKSLLIKQTFGLVIHYYAPLISATKETFENRRALFFTRKILSSPCIFVKIAQFGYNKKKVGFFYEKQ